jgi:hypothetical protein
MTQPTRGGNRTRDDVGFDTRYGLMSDELPAVPGQHRQAQVAYIMVISDTIFHRPPLTLAWNLLHDVATLCRHCMRAINVGDELLAGALSILVTLLSNHAILPNPSRDAFVFDKFATPFDPRAARRIRQYMSGYPD